MIVTSRAALHVSGEQEYPVPGLPTPPDPEPSQRPRAAGHARRDAARSTRPRSASTPPSACSSSAPWRSGPGSRSPTRTRRRSPPSAPGSTGMPLAIELAAARIKILSPDAILARLEHQLDLLAAGARDLPARQQTLRGAIAWSYDLLDDGAKRLLDRLSVFASGFDLASAEAICGPSSEIGGDIVDGLMALVDQSLVKVEETADGRAAFPAPRHHPRVRRRAARGARRDRPHPGPPSRLVRGARGAGRGRAVRAPTSGAGSTASSSSTTTSGRSSTGRSRPRTRRWRSAWPSRCGASGRSTATSPRPGRRLEAMAAAPWSHDDPRLRARS